jgi:hypothetical protein
MRFSIEMTPLKVQSFGKCIFCGSTENLTDEHIVPEALTGIGEMIIAYGSCVRCNNYANETYEQPALMNDFLPVRSLLQLKRKRRGKKGRPRQFPKTSFTATPDNSHNEFTEDLPLHAHPKVWTFAVPPVAGLLAGVDRSAGSEIKFRSGILYFGFRSGNPEKLSIVHNHIVGMPERVTAKMAYCWAVAMRGLDAFDTSDLLDLLLGRREDVFNFVGWPVTAEPLPFQGLHGFHFRKRGDFTTVLVHLFASFGGPAFEVVIGKEK